MKTSGRGPDGSPIQANPTPVGGVDPDGNLQTVTLNSDGYIFIANDAANPVEVVGPVADDNPAFGYPVEVGGQYRSDWYANEVENLDVGTILLDSIRAVVTRPRNYDSSVDAAKTIDVWSKNDNYEFADFSNDVSDSAANGVYSSYFEMDSFQYFSIQYQPGVVNTDGYKSLKIYVSNSTGLTAATADYIDVTNTFFGVSSFDSTPTVNTDEFLSVDTACVCKYIKVELTLSGLEDGQDSDWTLLLKKMTG